VDKSNFKKRRGAGLISGLTLLLASAMPLAVTAADEAAAKQLEIVQKGIPHDAIFGINIVGKNGYASGGAGYILETKDGGSTWAKMESGTQVSLLGIGIGGDHRIVVGQQGTVLIQKDGKWVAGKSNSDKRLLNVDVNAAGLAVAVGEFGTILRSKDGGDTWEPKVLDWASYRDDGYEPHIYIAWTCRITAASCWVPSLLTCWSLKTAVRPSPWRTRVRSPSSPCTCCRTAAAMRRVRKGWS